jgi:ribonucrease Y
MELLIGVIAFLVGGGVAWVSFTKALKARNRKIIQEAQAEAEIIKKDKILQAKDKFLELKAEYENDINNRNAKMLANENRIKQKELSVTQKIEELQRKTKEVDTVRENLNGQLELIDKKKEEIERVHRQQVEQLEAISGMSGDDAKEMLIESMKAEAKTEAMSYVNDIMDEAKINANKEAKRIVLQTVQRVATETAIENSVTIFHIDSDEIKGRIIGREGRNIRALEAATGVEIVVDDTPEAIVLSAFDPMRREVARLALHQLVTDGRIHPARIEEW